jgi:hypothetical protein
MVFQYFISIELIMKRMTGLKIFIFCFFGLAFVTVGCKKSGNVKSKPILPEKVLRQSGDPVIQLFRDTVYLIQSSISLKNGQRMVIDPGTVIKFGTLASPNLGDLTVNAGALLIANGTQQHPVVFTSILRSGSQKANWGGITITGRSFNNSRGNTGIANDNSGSLQFVRIEFGSLTLDAVGDLTTINNVMVSYASGANGSSRPAIEIDGGTFNARNLVTYANGGPSDIYITKGFTGRLQNILTLRHPFFGRRGFPPSNSLSGVFIENNPSNPKTARPYTFPVISNMTVIGPNNLSGTAADYLDTTYKFQNGALITTGSTCFRIRNSVFCGFHSSAWYLDDFETADNFRAGVSEIRNSLFQAHLTDRTFYLDPNVFPPFASPDFKNFVLTPANHDSVFASIDVLRLIDPFKYDDGPNLLPNSGSLLLSGASFSGTDFSNTFFQQVAYIGAIGPDNWLKDWTNFTPLKSNYNYPD